MPSFNYWKDQARKLFNRNRKKSLGKDTIEKQNSRVVMDNSRFQHPEVTQARCSLFSRLPGEVRNLVYLYALFEYSTQEDLYDPDTCYLRPDYFARGRSNTALLRTCQRIYKEAWFLPWTCREQNLFLTVPNRKPETTTTVEDLRDMISHIFKAHGQDATIIDRVRVFPQLWSLEPGRSLQEILDIPHFNPKTFTITLRHTDWWYWESDQPLYIDSTFARTCKFPNSVTHVKLELESIERRRPQIEDIAKQMRDSWSFRRHDDSYLVVDQHLPDLVSRWEGSSTWNNQRWLNDETKPGRLSYYVQSVTFMAQSLPIAAEDPRSRPALLMATGYPQNFNDMRSFDLDDLQSRGIGPEHSANEVYRLMSLYTDECPCRYSGQGCCGEGLGAGWCEGGKEVCTNCLQNDLCNYQRSEVPSVQSPEEVVSGNESNS